MPSNTVARRRSGSTETSVYPVAVAATATTGGGASPSKATSSPASAAPTTYCGDAGVMTAAT